MEPRLPLYIPAPCHESWNKMQKHGNGRFCGTCEKVVVDFTKMSNEDIKKYFLSHKKEKVCGLFNDDQINQDLKYIKPEGNYFSELKSLFLKIAAVVSINLVSIYGNAQNSEKIYGKNIIYKIPDLNQKKITLPSARINGKVLAKKLKSPLSGIEVVIVNNDNTEIGIGVTNKKGDYSIKLSDTLDLNQNFIVSIREKQSYTRRRERVITTSQKINFYGLDFKDQYILYLDRKVKKKLFNPIPRRTMGCPSYFW